MDLILGENTKRWLIKKGYNEMDFSLYPINVIIPAEKIIILNDASSY
jgi:hypothetical protein